MRPVVLDVTRTISPKSIMSPTGVDRVERAYIKHFLGSPRHSFYLCRFRRGLALLDRPGMSAIFDRILGNTDWGSPDLRGVLRGFAGKVEADIRRHAIWTGPHAELSAQLPDALTYLNVNHSNLTPETLGAFRKIDAKIIALVHDMIPMDDPQFQTPASVEKFEARMRALSGAADLIIATSGDVAERSRHWFDHWGRCPEIAINYLGIEPRKVTQPKTFQRPAFIQLGTIEPRKNHTLLLDVWARLGDLPEAARPVLHIIGRRGWLNEDVFARLDSEPFMGRDVIEHGTLTDDQITSYLLGASALLFPTFAEGFGLPLFEALDLGTPVIASDIAVFRELADGQAQYLDPTDVQTWRSAILNATKSRPKPSKPLKMPNWEQHFAAVETHI